MEEFPSFEPQNKIPNLEKEIERIATQTHKHITYLKINDETDWYPFVDEICKSCDVICSPQYCVEDSKDILYKWTQTDNYIQIVINDVPKDQIEIDEKHISCSKISGDWLWPIHDINVEEIGSITQIEFNTEDSTKWPLLIKGGQADGLSCFYISMIATQGKKNEVSSYYLQKGAMANHHSCTMAYALLVFEGATQEESVHWFARGVLNHADLTCGFCLCTSLIEGRGVEQNPRLAEYMLNRLCVEGFPDAFTRLGILYLQGAIGVKKMPKKAQQLLTIAAYQFMDEQAREILEKTPWDQLITDEAKKEEEEKKKAEEEEKHKDDPGASDYIIAGGVLAGLVGAGVWAFNKFGRK